MTAVVHPYYHNKNQPKVFLFIASCSKAEVWTPSLVAKGGLGCDTKNVQPGTSFPATRNFDLLEMLGKNDYFPFGFRPIFRG